MEEAKRFTTKILCAFPGTQRRLRVCFSTGRAHALSSSRSIGTSTAKAESGWSLNDSEMDAKAALQKFNGCAGASLEWLPKRIESLPVRRGNAGHEPRFQDGWISEKVKFDVRKET